MTSAQQLILCLLSASSIILVMCLAEDETINQFDENRKNKYNNSCLFSQRSSGSWWNGKETLWFAIIAWVFVVVFPIFLHFVHFSVVCSQMNLEERTFLECTVLCGGM